MMIEWNGDDLIAAWTWNVLQTFLRLLLIKKIPLFRSQIFDDDMPLYPVFRLIKKSRVKKVSKSDLRREKEEIFNFFFFESYYLWCDQIRLHVWEVRRSSISPLNVHFCRLLFLTRSKVIQQFLSQWIEIWQSASNILKMESTN